MYLTSHLTDLPYLSVIRNHLERCTSTQEDPVCQIIPCTKNTDDSVPRNNSLRLKKQNVEGSSECYVLNRGSMLPHSLLYTSLYRIIYS